MAAALVANAGGCFTACWLTGALAHEGLRARREAPVPLENSIVPAHSAVQTFGIPQGRDEPVAHCAAGGRTLMTAALARKIRMTVPVRLRRPAQIPHGGR